ncbi:MAG: DUF1080 domain-containing protein [bacterium]|nr:DUF1080 domain-containing protein [bacterium]
MKGREISLIIFTFLVALAGLGSLAAEETASGLIHFNDEKTGQPPQGWQITETNSKNTPARWEIINADSKKGASFAVVKSDNAGRTFNVALKNEPRLLDAFIKVEVRALSGTEDQGGGPVWRAIDGNNYYTARWNPLEDNFRVYFVKDGDRKQLASADVKLDPKKWHSIAIQMRGSHIEAYLDGKLELEVDDETFAAPGRVGLWTKADACTAFDDLKIESLD